MAIDVTQVVPPTDEELDEQWERAEPEGGATGVDWELLRVEAHHAPGDDHWQVIVSMAEFVRSDPLETRMSEAVTGAIAAVPGVTQAVRDDTEAWIAFGAPSGEELVRAASAAVDTVYPAARDEREAWRRLARSRRPGVSAAAPADSGPSLGPMIACFVLAVVGVLLVVAGIAAGTGGTLVIGAVAVVFFGGGGLALLLLGRRRGAT